MHEVLGVVKTIFCAGVRYGHLGSAEVVERRVDGDDRTDMQRPECNNSQRTCAGAFK